MLRALQEESTLTFLLRKVGVLSEERAVELPLLEMPAAPVPLASFYDDFRLPDIIEDRFLSKSSRKYLEVKRFHQKFASALVEAQQELEATANSRRQFYRRMLPFILVMGSAGIITLSALMAWRYSHIVAVGEVEKLGYRHNIERLQARSVPLVETVLSYFNQSEWPRLKEVLFGQHLQQFFSEKVDKNRHGLEGWRVASALSEYELKDWVGGNFYRCSGLCWTESGVYQRPNKEDVCDTYPRAYYFECLNGNYTLPAHPIATCYQIIKNMCDLQHFYLEQETPTKQFFAAVAVYYQIHLETLKATANALYESPEAWILGTVTVGASLAILMGFTYLLCSFSNTKKEYVDDIEAAVRRTSELTVGELKDAGEKQRVRAFSADPELGVVIPQDTTIIDAIKKLRHPVRILNQQRFREHVLFRPNGVPGSLPDDVKRVIADAAYEKPDLTKDESLLDWMKM